MSYDDRITFLEESDLNIHNFLYLVAIFARAMKTFKEEEVTLILQCIHKVGTVKFAHSSCQKPIFHYGNI